MFNDRIIYRVCTYLIIKIVMIVTIELFSLEYIIYIYIYIEKKTISLWSLHENTLWNRRVGSRGST